MANSGVLQRFPEISHIHSLVSEVLYFNANDSVIVFNYLNDYRDLADFYAKENVFSNQSRGLNAFILAAVHRATLDHQEYSKFFSQNHEDVPTEQAPNFVRGLERIGPEVFGLVPADGLKFFALYQR